MLVTVAKWAEVGCCPSAAIASRERVGSAELDRWDFLLFAAGGSLRMCAAIGAPIRAWALHDEPYRRGRPKAPRLFHL